MKPLRRSGVVNRRGRRGPNAATYHFPAGEDRLLHQYSLLEETGASYISQNATRGRTCKIFLGKSQGSLGAVNVRER
jgi:hypothetical protein